MLNVNKLFEIIGRQYVATLEMSEREDALIKKHEEELKGVKASEDLWWKEYQKEKQRADNLEARILGLKDEYSGEDELNEEAKEEEADW